MWTTCAAFVILAELLLRAPAPAYAQTEGAEPLGIGLEGFDYPHPVDFLAYTIDDVEVRMGYMDVRPPDGGSGRAVVLFHGKNWFGAYWEDTIEALGAAGYRVIVPDQIGFGKSSKPEIPYSFHRMAFDTKALLDTLGLDRIAVVGHSMGGMLAARFALMYPESTTHLVLENPIGLEDYRLKVPYVPTSRIYESTLRTTEEQLRQYIGSYFVEWKPAYDRYVQAHYRQTLSGEYPRLAMASALTAQMIYEQPVIHEFTQIRPKTLLVIGQEDRTALGKGRVDEETQETLGRYPELGERAAELIPDAKLVRLEGVGHVPHMAVPDRFHAELIGFLAQ